MEDSASVSGSRSPRPGLRDSSLGWDGTGSFSTGTAKPRRKTKTELAERAGGDHNRDSASRLGFENTSLRVGRSWVKLSLIAFGVLRRVFLAVSTFRAVASSLEGDGRGIRSGGATVPSAASSIPAGFSPVPAVTGAALSRSGVPAHGLPAGTHRGTAGGFVRMEIS